MILFATPDFGAGACDAGGLLLVWGVVLVLVAVGVVVGMNYIRKESKKAKVWGYCLVIVCVLVPLACCFGPPQAVRLSKGNYPLDRYPNGVISKGMTADEVTAALGTPHERVERDQEAQWFYWLDSYGIGWFGVRFDADGRVSNTFGN